MFISDNNFFFSSYIIVSFKENLIYFCIPCGRRKLRHSSHSSAIAKMHVVCSLAKGHFTSFDIARMI